MCTSRGKGLASSLAAGSGVISRSSTVGGQGVGGGVDECEGGGGGERLLCERLISLQGLPWWAGVGFGPPVPLHSTIHSTKI